MKGTLKKCAVVALYSFETLVWFNNIFHHIAMKRTYNTS